MKKKHKKHKENTTMPDLPDEFYDEPDESIYEYVLDTRYGLRLGSVQFNVHIGRDGATTTVVADPVSDGLPATETSLFHHDTKVLHAFLSSVLDQHRFLAEAEGWPL